MPGQNVITATLPKANSGHGQGLQYILSHRGGTNASRKLTGNSPLTSLLAYGEIGKSQHFVAKVALH